MRELIGKDVEISANEIVYHGTLVEIGESEVYIQTETGWITIPFDRIVEIREMQ